MEVERNWTQDGLSPTHLPPPFGQVRDFSFSPDTGLLTKIMYDDFGLTFLPATFFDTYSISISDVVALGPSGVIVGDEAKYRERR